MQAYKINLKPQLHSHDYALTTRAISLPQTADTQHRGTSILSQSSRQMQKSKGPLDSMPYNMLMKDLKDRRQMISDQLQGKEFVPKGRPRYAPTLQKEYDHYRLASPQPPK